MQQWQKQRSFILWLGIINFFFSVIATSVSVAWWGEDSSKANIEFFLGLLVALLNIPAMLEGLACITDYYQERCGANSHILANLLDDLPKMRAYGLLAGTIGALTSASAIVLTLTQVKLDTADNKTPATEIKNNTSLIAYFAYMSTQLGSFIVGGMRMLAAFLPWFYNEKRNDATEQRIYTPL